MIYVYMKLQSDHLCHSALQCHVLTLWQMSLLHWFMSITLLLLLRLHINQFKRLTSFIINIGNVRRHHCGSKVSEMRDVQLYPRPQILYFVKHQIITNSKLKDLNNRQIIVNHISSLLHIEWQTTKVLKYFSKIKPTLYALKFNIPN